LHSGPEETLHACWGSRSVIANAGNTGQMIGMAASLRPILIAGPTASGKSELALALAERLSGAIINADSMQVYRELRVLTARPSTDEEARVPHLLYGHVPAAEPYSVARWLADVSRALGAVRALGRRPIIIGGTGLYFKALLEGLAPVPEIPHDVRHRWREVAKTAAPGELHRLLSERDPAMAERLAPADLQRISRALEVMEATGRSLAEWQREAGRPLIAEDEAIRLLVERPRAELQERADRRFDRMMREGAVEEVRALAALALSPYLPAMRALGVPALSAMISGALDRDDAVAAAKLETRQYIKRQETWLRRHMMSWNRIEPQFSIDLAGLIVRNIDHT
jgi:tRNA dimethylallyltransferase